MIADLKGKLKLAPALADMRKKDRHKKDVKGGLVNKVKNKKNTANKAHQKKEEAWKKLPPKDDEPTTKDIAGKKYQWCIHHMAWGVHSSQECCLGASHKDALKENKDKPKDRAIFYAAAAATIANPSPSSQSSPMTKNDGLRCHVYGE
jgi:hypothetical protein